METKTKTNEKPLSWMKLIYFTKAPPPYLTSVYFLFLALLISKKNKDSGWLSNWINHLPGQVTDDLLYCLSGNVFAVLFVHFWNHFYPVGHKVEKKLLWSQH